MVYCKFSLKDIRQPFEVDFFIIAWELSKQNFRDVQWEQTAFISKALLPTKLLNKRVAKGGNHLQLTTEKKPFQLISTSTFTYYRKGPENQRSVDADLHIDRQLCRTVDSSESHCMIKTELKGCMPFVSFPSCTHKCEPLRETFVSHSNNAAALLCFTAFEQSAVGKWLNKHEEYETAHLYLQAKLLQNNNGLNFLPL